MRLAVRLAALAFVVAAPLGAQDTASKADWEWFALPALNFNSDEGFGYGALLELYNYRGGVKPYRLMIRPLLALSTKGKRDITVAMDAPGLVEGWRFDLFLGREQQLATPYYGFGNNTVKDTTLSDPPDPYYYRYGRTQYRGAFNVQRRLSSAVRWLAGVGYADITTDPTPFDSGTTLLQQQLSGPSPTPANPKSTIGSLRTGFVVDTRDREVGPTRGNWIDVLVQGVNPGGFLATEFMRATLTARTYRSLTSKLVYAQRVVVQITDGSFIPFYDANTIQTSSTNQAEGLGGSSSMRGIEKNRYTDNNIVFANLELRYRFKELRLLGKPAYMVGTGFFDAGRVAKRDFWAPNSGPVHTSAGAGLRLGLGQSFLVAFDVGRSSDATQIYIGLGYPF